MQACPKGQYANWPGKRILDDRRVAARRLASLSWPLLPAAFWLHLLLVEMPCLRTEFRVREHGFEAVLFGCAQALRKHDDFDEACCIILDINLSDGSGIDLRNQLKATGILLPVIYITGNDSDATRLAALQSGCIAYLVKPFPAKSLIEPLEMASAASA